MQKAIPSTSMEAVIWDVVKGMTNFESDQKHTGVNKYNHYQFGEFTCVCCKSDDTKPEEGNEKTHRRCNVCGALFGIKK